MRSTEEKLRLVAAVQARMNEGATALVACREVGIHREQFFNWRKRLVQPAPMRPVEIVDADMTALIPAPVTALVPAATTAVAEVAPAVAPSPARGELCLVAPGGYRIEGLGIETAAALLRALA